jgi:hypothetical protein
MATPQIDGQHPGQGRWKRFSGVSADCQFVYTEQKLNFSRKVG